MKTVSVNFMVWILLFSRTSGILFGFSMVINLRGFDRSIGVDVTSSAEFLIAAFPCLKFLRHFTVYDFTFPAMVWVLETFHF